MTAPAPTPAREALAALRAYDDYEATPTDRGGKSGPKGKAWAHFLALKDAALRLPVDAPTGPWVEPTQRRKVLERHARHLREEAGMDRRAAETSQNPSAKPCFAAWAVDKDEAAEAIEAALISTGPGVEEIARVLKECADAVAFFDRVKASSLAERIAVGTDHAEWVESACRKAGALSTRPAPASEVREATPHNRKEVMPSEEADRSPGSNSSHVTRPQPAVRAAGGDPAPSDPDGIAERLRQERDQLRQAFLEAGNASGAALSVECSHDFLLLVPTEIKLKLDRLRATIARLEEEKATAEAEWGLCEQQLAAAEALLAVRDKRIADLETGVSEVIGCFQAAWFEGLQGELLEADSDIGSLRDLVERRLLYAEVVARSLLTPESTS